ncbi:hypothetical protein PRIC1_014519 [Phytophthora ramorum]
MEDAAELLQRARRLCLAAEELQLPLLLSGYVRDATERDEREETVTNDQAAPENEVTDKKLPLIAAAGPIKRKKAGNQSGEKERKLQEERKRQGRQLGKVKQAQERARARVARTNHLEQQQTLRAAELQQLDALNTAEQCAEKIRRAQESRQRAKQRVRMKRGEKETPPSSAAPGLRTEAAKVKSFRRETIKRLQASTQQTISSDKNERQSTPERSQDVDQKLLERKFRHETAVRLRRMKQLAESQKRQEREEFELGLQKFKSKVRELDRAAKGLRKQPSLPSLPQFNNPSFETKPAREELFTPPPSTDAPSSTSVDGKSTWYQTQDAESSSDSDDSFDARNSLSRPDPTELSSPQTAEVSTRSNRSRTKLPAWKQPPVPIQPMQCYSYKAILPAYSRASTTAPACPTAVTLGSSTRLRAQEISRQMKSK